MKTTQPVFIVGSGRSGTLALTRALMKSDAVEAHHEYLFENILSDAVLYFLDRLDDKTIMDKLTETHVTAVYYSKKPIWIDCSNALTWVVKPLSLLFPEAKFVHVIRNGRRVVSSFYHKFVDVMYDEASVSVLSDWLEFRSALKPPPEKKYWRPIPLENDPEYKDFLSMNRFEKLCYYWKKVNEHIGEVFRTLDSRRIMTIKFEDLIVKKTFFRFTDFLDIRDTGGMFEAMARPVNVHIPKTFPLSTQQDESFKRFCGETMVQFGYKIGEDYEVNYHPDM